VAVFDKRLLPVTPILVSSGIDELLELLICHLIPIHPVLREFDWRDMEEALEVELRAPARNPNHPIGDAPIHCQGHVESCACLREQQLFPHRVGQ
jgi:hypothetical protein